MTAGLFIVPALQRGRSGVGDYARKLSAELTRRGHSLRLCAWHDPFVSVPTHERDEEVELLRLPTRLHDSAKQAILCDEIANRKPTWVSLQLVTYGYHVKGLPFGLGNRLSNIIKGAQVEIMFHELWTGGSGARLRHRVYGFFQRRIVRDLVRKLSPVSIHTHAVPYLEMLHKEGWNARKLSLFSNIPIAEPWSASVFNKWILSRTGFNDFASREVYCFFGSIYPEWQPKSLLPILRRRLELVGRKGVLLSIGQRGEASDCVWRMLEAQSDDSLRPIELGHLEEKEVSQCLLRSDYGIATTPPDLIEKSASAAAMFEHGLPVLASRPPAYSNAVVQEIRATTPLLVSGEALTRLGAIKKRIPDSGGLGRVAGQFISDFVSQTSSVENDGVLRQ